MTSSFQALIEKSSPPQSNGRVVDHAVAHRVGDLAGVGVDLGELARRRLQQVAVLVPRPRPGDLGVPAAVPLRLHGMAIAVPVIERSDDGDFLSVRRPDTKCSPTFMTISRPFRPASSQLASLEPSLVAIDGYRTANPLNTARPTCRTLIVRTRRIGYRRTQTGLEPKPIWFPTRVV